jgi:hypothetical protein
MNIPLWDTLYTQHREDWMHLTNRSRGLDGRGFDSEWGLGIFLLTTASRPAVGPTQTPIRWVPGELSLGVKRPGREADHSPQSSAEIKNAPSWRGSQLKKHRDNFTYTATFYVCV